MKADARIDGRRPYFARPGRATRATPRTHPGGRKTAGLESRLWRARITRNGSEIADTIDPQAATGEIITIVGHVAATLAVHGERLRAGEIIITGSITPPLWMTRGETVEFRLEPVGSLTLTFA